MPPPLPSTTTPRVLGAALAVAALLVLGGCGAQESAAPAGTAAPSAAPSSAASSSADPSAPSSPAASVPEGLTWSARTVAGEPFEASSLAGRPTVLWFWAPWCPTCRGQIPQVQGIADTYGDEVNVVGVGSLDDAAAIADFAGDVPQITQLADEEGAVWKRYGVVEQSSFVLLDADGSVAAESGYRGAEELDAEIAGLVG